MEKQNKKMICHISGYLLFALSMPVVANSNAITAAELDAINKILNDKKVVKQKSSNATPPKTQQKKKVEKKSVKNAKYIPTEKLLGAIRTGDLKMVKGLIRQGADLTPGRGEPLTLAVRTRNIAIARELLIHKADPNQEGFAYESSGVLGTAVKQKNFEMVRLLLQHGANPNIGAERLKMNNIPDTPLYIAVQNNDFTMSKMLIDKGAKVDVLYPISMQAQAKDKRIVTTRNILNHVNQKKHPQLYNYLVDKGARPIAQ